MAKIKKVFAREILDSRGDPTVEACVILDNGIRAVALVPSGASRGKYEALEMRDQDQKRYLGKGVLKACENVVQKIGPAIIGKDPSKQRAIDQVMIDLDGTENKSRLGANAILGVSLAVARVAAQNLKMDLWEWIRKLFTQGSQHKKITPLRSSHLAVEAISEDLPRPCFNVINGGKHADNKLEFQEFWIIPVGAKSFREAVRMGSEVFHNLLAFCKEQGYDTDVGNEGGFGPELDSNDQAVELIVSAIQKAGYRLPEDFVLGLDIAASTFYENGEYLFKSEGLSLSSERLVSLYKEWIEKYPLKIIEDGLSEDDWQNWVLMTEKIGEKVQIVGDDLLVTNPKRLQKAIDQAAANSILIKPNQIGTLSETLECIRLAHKHAFGTMISHRSGDTCDPFIADLTVGTRAGQIKTGSLVRSERTSKYNRLMEIEEKIQKKSN